MSPKKRSIASQDHPLINFFSVTYTGDGFQIGDQMIPTPIALRRAIKDQLQSGMRFDFGIPATAIRIESALPHVRGTLTQILTHPEALSDDGTTTLQITVPSTGGTVDLTITIATLDQPPMMDSIVPLAFDLKQMLLFDGSGDRIYPPIELMEIATEKAKA